MYEKPIWSDYKYEHYFLERDAPYNPLCTHYSNDNDNDNVVGHSTKYTFYRVTY